MALSQLQCLDDNHVNSRINQSKPEFFYSEEQRLALESLLEGGREGFDEFIKTTSVRSFLSDLEVARLSGLVEAFGARSPGAAGDSEEVQGSLQYWPDRSDTSLPDLDMGWPDCAAYRGVTRAQVYAQPPLEGDVHIKEVVRKTIAQAQKVIAVVMDLFTDADIFKDLLDASFKRKVPVYLILEATGVPHFLKMCERVAMHTGHLKNLRVRSIGGIEFCSRSSKKVCGSQSQKFMFVDGDKAVSGSYSYTWTASRLDRNIITVLTGQAADAFDKLFREMYAISNGVNLNKIKLDDEPKPEPTPQTSSAPLPSATMALKLINPKYALVSGSTTAKSNRTPSERCTNKNENVKQTKYAPEAPQIHPGLLHLDKANMIEYLPVWPEPDPPNDVIGFINIRDYNKPLQAHLMRSELFEVSQAIRFKDPIHVPERPLPEKAFPKSKLEPLYQLPNSAEQTLMRPQTQPEENDIHAKTLDQIKFPSCSQTEKAEFVSLRSNEVKDSKEVKDTSVVYVVGNQMDSSAKQEEEIYANSQCLAKTITDSSSGAWYRNLKMSNNPQLQTVTSSHTSQSEPKKFNSLIAQFETTSVKQNFDKPKEPIKTAPVEHNERHKCKEADTNETNGVNMPYHTETPKHNSNISSTSEEYYECSDWLTVDSGFEGTVQGMLTGSGVSEQDGYPGYPNTIVTHSLSANTMQHQQLASMASSSEHELGSRRRKETEEPYLDSGLREQSDVQHETEMTIHSELEDTKDALVIEADRLSELIFKDDKQRIQETDASSSESKPLPNSLETITDAQVASRKVCKELSVHELGHVPYSVANNVFGLKPVEVDNTIRIQSELSKNKLSNSVLRGKEAVPIILVQTKTELQSIVFSDRVKEIPLHSGYTYTSNLAHTIEVKDAKQSRHQEKVVDLQAVYQMDPHAKMMQEEHCHKTAQLSETEEMIKVENVDLEQAVKVKSVCSSAPELKENEAEETVDIKERAKPPQQKTPIGLKVAKHNADAQFSARKRAFSAERMGKDEQVREHTCTNRVHRNQPEAKPNLVGEVRKPRRPKPIRTPQEDRGSTKASVTKLHSSNHPTRPATFTLGAQNFLYRNQPRQNRASNALPTLPDKFSTRHTAPSRSSQSQLGRSRTEAAPGHLRSSQKKPQAKLDRTTPIQLGQSSRTERSASTTEDSSSSSSTTFLRRSRSLEVKTADLPQAVKKITRSINNKDQE